MKNNYTVHNDVAFIKIESPKHGSFETTVSVEDLKMLLEIECSIYVVKHKHDIYANIYLTKKKRSTRLHRYLFGEPSDMVIDHIDHNTLCNERTNLRAVTQVENTQNMRRVRSDNTSGYRGVTKKRDRWEAYGYANGKRHFLGSYLTAKEAGEAAASYRALKQSFSPEARELENPVMPTWRPRGKENNTSGIKGITWDKKYKHWKTQLRMNNKLHVGGFYKSLDEAVVGLEDLKKQIGYNLDHNS